MAPLDDRQNVAEWPPYGGNHHRQHQGALLPQSAQASPAQQRLPSHHGGHSRLSTRPHQTQSRLLLSPPTCYNGGVNPIIGVKSKDDMESVNFRGQTPPRVTNHKMENTF